jgi:hypothetical protein
MFYEKKEREEEPEALPSFHEYKNNDDYYNTHDSCSD